MKYLNAPRRKHAGTFGMGHGRRRSGSPVPGNQRDRRQGDQGCSHPGCRSRAGLGRRPRRIPHATDFSRCVHQDRRHPGPGDDHLFRDRKPRGSLHGHPEGDRRLGATR